jgi:hypothetical protein
MPFMVGPAIMGLAAGAGKGAGAAAITSAAITAGSGLAGSALSSRSNNKATRAQMDATDKALAFEKEREAYNRSERERETAEMRRAYEARERIRLALLKRYGVNVGAGGGGGAGASSDVRAPLNLGSMAGPRPTLSRQMAPPPMVAPPIAPQGMRSLADWSGYERNH